MNLGSTPGVPRGCGYRTEGGVYLETGVSCFGKTPLWRFITDQPVPFRAPHTLGVDVVEVEGVHHVINHVGSKYWPFVSDFIEEGLRWGFSTKIPRTLDLSMLGKESRMIHVHEKGCLYNPGSFKNHRSETGHRNRCAQHRLDCFEPVRNSQQVVAAHLLTKERVMLGETHQHILEPYNVWSNPFGEDDPPKLPTACNAWQWFFAQPTLCTVKRGVDVVEVFTNDELRKIWNDDPGAQPSLFVDMIHNEELSVEFTREANSHGTNTYRVWPIFASYPQHPEPRLDHGMIATLPITQVSVIEAEDGSHAETFMKKHTECTHDGGLHVAQMKA